ncbi:MAG: phosphatase [Oscillospiraceae bacterium]
MKILVDTHTHTNCSDHAHSTILENIQYAKKHGMEMICMTDHAPSIPDGAHMWHFHTMRGLPREVDGVKLMFGIEGNVVDTDGNLDVPLDEQMQMDMMIASIHEPCYRSRSFEEHTKTWLNVLENPYVTILGHSGNDVYKYDIETVVRKAKEKNKCIEINNHSFTVRKGSKENCRNIALMCKEIGTPIVVSSDAHSCFEVGVFENAIKMLEDINFPEELIMNTTAERFTKYLKTLKA